MYTLSKKVSQIMIYTLNDFQIISSNGFNVVLPIQTVDLINNLSKHVGSPNYIKTPVFNKRDNSGSDPEKKRKKPRYKNQDSGWSETSGKNEVITSNIVFKNPLNTKKNVTGVESIIQSIRAILNKVGSNNDVELNDNLFVLIDNMLETDISAEEVIQISNKTSDILINTSFYSRIYSKLYGKLMERYEFINNTFSEKAENYLSTYDNIIDVNPDEDYDLFCNKNKENDNRKAFSLFCVNLYSINKIDGSIIINFIHELINVLDNTLDDSKHVFINDEIIENISIFISTRTDIYEKCSDITLVTSNNENITVKEYIIKLSKKKPKQHKGISTKALFKLMELMDSLG